MQRARYDRRQIEDFIGRLLAEMGPERFSAMRLLELEKFLRARDATAQLPAKRVLRAAINEFRISRWPHTAPRRFSPRV